MSKKIAFPKYSGTLGVLLVLILIFFIPITGCVQTSSPTEIATEELSPADTATPTATPTSTIDHEATDAAAEAKMTEDALATEMGEAEATQAELVGRRATAEGKATSTEQARKDAAATQRAMATSTPTLTPRPTKTNTSAAPAAAPPSSGRIVRNPGEKDKGDHYVTVKNKTGGNVTILMDNDDFKYQFNVPDGTHKIYLRPGFYFYTVYLCGGQFSGSHQFNAKWTWEMKCQKP